MLWTLESMSGGGDSTKVVNCVALPSQFSSVRRRHISAVPGVRPLFRL